MSNRPTPDAGLVGRHHHPPAPLVEPGDRLQRAGNRLPLFGRLDELPRVEIDDAVAVENDELHRPLCSLAQGNPAARGDRIAAGAIHGQTDRREHIRHLVHQAGELVQQREAVG
jgi:hypothetical protein